MRVAPANGREHGGCRLECRLQRRDIVSETAGGLCEITIVESKIPTTATVPTRASEPGPIAGEQ